MVIQKCPAGHLTPESWDPAQENIAAVAMLKPMGFLPDTQNCGLRMRRECQERFLRHRL